MARYKFHSECTENLSLPDGRKITLHIYKEYRPNVRYSLGKKGPIFRFPAVLSKKKYASYYERGVIWVQQQLDNNASVTSLYKKHFYKNGDVLQVGQRSYSFFVQEQARRSSKANLLISSDGQKIIELLFAVGMDNAELHRTQTSLVSRTIAQDFKSTIVQRVKQLNALHFQETIQGIFLKHTTSKWGSCSSQRNINLSSRLLFAPDDVIDYVIIHELAHLKEMNHSTRFWALVEKAMPDYKEKQQWLKENGARCQF